MRLREIFTPLFCSYFFIKRRSIVDTMTDFKEKIKIKEQVKSRSNLIHKVYCTLLIANCYLMFVSDDIFLIWNFDFDNRIVVQNNALATQSRFDAWIDCTVNEIFFFVTDFLQIFVA